MIVSRKFRSGQRIRQAELAAMLGVSTMPIREALLRLVAEGMVTAEANRSFFVADTTAKDIEDIYWMHAMLQGELTARAWDRRSQRLIDTLEGHRREFLAAVKRDDGYGLREANWQFHAAINRVAAAPTIAQALRRTSYYYPDFQSEVPGWIDLAGQWQRGVLKEFKNGTRDAARAVVSRSLQRAAEMFIGSVWSDETNGDT
jgi:DNA-binding GntR family transcriptional regulator